MEAAREKVTGAGILGAIRPPKLEDAGLEDSALSPDSIKQAFFKAASSIRSFVSDENDSNGGCVQDRGPTNPKSGDWLADSTPDPPGSCENEKGGGLPDVMGDKVGVGVPGDTDNDKLIDVNGNDLKESNGKKKGCIEDGLEGLKIDEEDIEKDGDEDEDEDEKKVPILAEALI